MGKMSTAHPSLTTKQYFFWTAVYVSQRSNHVFFNGNAFPSDGGHIGIFVLLLGPGVKPFLSFLSDYTNYLHAFLMQIVFIYIHTLVVDLHMQI